MRPFGLRWHIAAILAVTMGCGSRAEDKNPAPPKADAKPNAAPTPVPMAPPAKPAPAQARSHEVGGTGFQDDAVSRAAELMKSGQAADAEALLVRYLIHRPDDSHARQMLMAARIAALENDIRQILSEQAKTRELIVGDPDYEAARARTDQAVRNRLDVVEYFLAQKRYPEAVQACNAILEDYPMNEAVLDLKLRSLSHLDSQIMEERSALLREKSTQHDDAINEALEKSVHPPEKPKLARDIFVFDEDIAEAERQKLKQRLQERVDLISGGEASSEPMQVRTAVEQLFKVAGLNYIILDSAIGSETVTINLQHETIETALSTLAKLSNVHYNFAAGTVFVAGATTDVLETEIIRIESGLTDVLKQPKLGEVQNSSDANGGANGGGGPQASPFGPGGGPGGGEGDKPNSDLEKFIEKIPDLVVGWPSSGHVYLERKSNSLYVTATPAAIAEVKRLLRALDYESVQVLIEARFVEATESAGRELGLDLGLGTENNHVTTASRSISSLGTAVPASGLFSTIQARDLNGFPDINATLKALESDGRVDTLSEPKILTLNNATGLIDIRQDIAYISTYENLSTSVPVQTTGTGNTTVSQQNALVPKYTKDYEGISLSIVPSVARNSDVITLNITPTVREMSQEPLTTRFSIPNGTGTPIQQDIQSPPLFDTRRLFTSLHIKSGQTVALGGLVKSHDQRNRSGVPYLSRIPGFGWLFGSETKSTDRRNLIILVTARIIDPGGSEIGDEIRRLRDTARVVLPAEVRQAEAASESLKNSAAPAQPMDPGAMGPWKRGLGR